MAPQQRTSAALLRWALDDTVASAEFATHSYVFDQFNGLHLDLVNHLTQSHPIRQRQDIENYLARLAPVAPLIDQGSGRHGHPWRPASWRPASSSSARSNRSTGS